MQAFNCVDYLGIYEGKSISLFCSLAHELSCVLTLVSNHTKFRSCCIAVSYRWITSCFAKMLLVRHTNFSANYVQKY